MRLAPRWISRDLSRLELFMSIIILAVLLSSFMRYSLQLFSQAEKRMFESTVININAALQYQAIFYQLNGEYEQLALMEDMNPMSYLQSAATINYQSDIEDLLESTDSTLSFFSPANYAGEINRFTKDTMEEGNWYFDQEQKLLIYLVSNPELFTTALKGKPRIIFKTNVNYLDKNNNGSYEAVVDEINSVKIQAQNTYDWKS